MGAIADIALGALDALLGGGNGSDALTRDDVAATFEDYKVAFQTIDDVFNTADSAANAAVGAATRAAGSATELGIDVKYDVEHIIQVIIPHSMKYLLGYIVSHYITPINIHLRKHDHQIAFLLGWRSQIDVWRHKFVDPHLEQWIGFQEWFNTWPRGVVFTVHDWLDHPDHFAQWAAPPLIGPIISYLSNRDHKESRDNLSQIMLRAWQEEPELTLRAIEQWLVS